MVEGETQRQMRYARVKSARAATAMVQRLAKGMDMTREEAPDTVLPLSFAVLGEFAALSVPPPAAKTLRS